nr:uncharacterized protein LOC109786336 [Aegilops tauschii subsp. strangulata]
MDQFHNGHHVRLRSRVHGMYLHADEDGRGVSLGHRRDSVNVAWAVHVYNVQAHYVLLQSAAYGRYLAATVAPAPRGHRGLRVVQRNHYHPEVGEMAWEAYRTGFGDEVLLRHAAGGRYLCANGKYLPWNNGVSVDGIDSVSTMMHWVVEHIPAGENIPRLPRQTGLPLPESLIRLLPSRVILCARAAADGTRFSLPFVFWGRSVFRLRNEVARRLAAVVDVPNLVMCFPTRDGRLFPLLVDLLPTSGPLFHIVVVTAGTPVFETTVLV